MSLLGLMTTYAIQKSPGLDVESFSDYEPKELTKDATWIDVLASAAGRDDENLHKAVRAVDYYRIHRKHPQRLTDECLKSCILKGLDTFKASSGGDSVK